MDEIAKGGPEDRRCPGSKFFETNKRKSLEIGDIPEGRMGRGFGCSERFRRYDTTETRVSREGGRGAVVLRVSRKGGRGAVVFTA